MWTERKINDYFSKQEKTIAALQSAPTEVKTTLEQIPQTPESKCQVKYFTQYC